MQYVYSIVGGLFVFVAQATHALASTHSANTNDSDGGTNANVEAESARLTNPMGGIESIPAFFQALLDIVMVFAIPFIVFFIIYAGFLYVMAQGKPEQIAKAHSALLYAIIGGVLILAANVLLAVVTGTVNEFTSP